MNHALFAVEWNGDCWQSVFPPTLAEYSQLHTTVHDALVYMAGVVKKLGSGVDVPEELL